MKKIMVTASLSFVVACGSSSGKKITLSPAEVDEAKNIVTETPPETAIEPTAAPAPSLPVVENPAVPAIETPVVETPVAPIAPPAANPFDSKAFYKKYSGRWVSNCVADMTKGSSTKWGYDLSSGKISTLTFKYPMNTDCIGAADPNDGSPKTFKINSITKDEEWILLEGDKSFSIWIVDDKSCVYKVDGKMMTMTKNK